ncbi:MAG TPA: LON peptidase substrate-binding domain-containing protein [Acidimicrobiales bacterium]|nr:LON peptidase substrate-binding domain-containing protein [Acidimicrobiales bacterium]
MPADVRLRRVGMFPLSTVLFPHGELALHVFEPRYRELTADCLAAGSEFGVVLIERGSEVGGGDERAGIGTLARIESATPLDGGRWALLTEATRRFRIRRWMGEHPYPSALIEELPDLAPAGENADLLDRAERAVRRVRALLSELGEVSALPGELSLGTAPEEIAWRLCSLAPLTSLDAQHLLETDDLADRLRSLEALCAASAADLTQVLAGG